MNFKLIILTSAVAFGLSFFTALISGAGFLISLVRGIILCLVFGLLSVGIHFIYEKFLNDGSSDSASSDNSQDNIAPIGNKVDITIDDEELQEEENTPKFVLTGQNQMLNKEDLKSQSAVLDDINSKPSAAVNPAKNAEDSDSPRFASNSQPQQTAASENAASSFKPVSLGVPSGNDTDELPAIENSLGDGSFLKQGNEESEDALDELPEMGNPAKLHDDTVTDSEFASNGKTSSRLSESMFPDGSKAESKDAALMAEALRTVLKNGE